MTVFLVLPLLLAPPPSQELDAPVQELTSGALCVDATVFSAWKDQTLTTASCKPTISESAGKCQGELVLALEHCAFPKGEPLKISGPGGATLTLKLEQASSCKQTIGLEGDQLSFRGSPPNPFTGDIIYLDTTGKVNRESIDGGKLKSPQAIADSVKLWASVPPGVSEFCAVDPKTSKTPVSEVQTPRGKDPQATESQDLGTVPDLEDARRNLGAFCWMEPDAESQDPVVTPVTVDPATQCSGLGGEDLSKCMKKATKKQARGAKRGPRKAKRGARKDKRTDRRAERALERQPLHRKTVCVWTDGKGKFVTVHKPRYLLPGKPLRFVLRGPQNWKLKARQEGTIGYSAELDDHSTTVGASLAGSGGARGSGQDTTLPATTQIWEFEGRGPGLAPIILEKEPGKEEHRVEIDLPRTYMGSLRVGISIVGNNPVNRVDGLGAVVPEYGGVKQPGSSTFEIVEKKDGKLAWELVLAYSVYPEAMIGGRNYRERLFSRNNWGFGPVVGLGIVSMANAKVDLLKSLYLGLEFEPVRHFSISAGPVFRRVDVLADGFRVGSALSDATVPTKERIGVGWFFMLTVSPRFMKTASPGK